MEGRLDLVGLAQLGGDVLGERAELGSPSRNMTVWPPLILVFLACTLLSHFIHPTICLTLLPTLSMAQCLGPEVLGDPGGRVCLGHLLPLHHLVAG